LAKCKHGEVWGACACCYADGVKRLATGAPKVSGKDNPAYDFPEGTTCVADLTDGMSFNQGNMLKAIVRLHSGKNSPDYELEKIKFYCEREERYLRNKLQRGQE